MIFYTSLFELPLGKAPEPAKAAINILENFRDRVRAMASLFGFPKGNKNLDRVEPVDLKTQP